MTKPISQERFDSLLVEIAEDWGAEWLITQVPGVYEAVSEYFNNDVLERWESLQGDHVTENDRAMIGRGIKDRT